MANEGDDAHIIEVASNGWWGIFMRMCHHGEMVYSAVDKRDFKLYKQYIKLDEKQAKTELLTRYYWFYGPATINDAAYFTKFKKTEIKDIMKILYLYSCEIEERMYYYY